MKNDRTAKYKNIAYLGPYDVVAIHDNGTINIQMNNVIDKYNIQNI